MKIRPQNIETLNLLYLDFPTLNKQLNVSLHFQKLSAILSGNCTQSKIQNLASLKRYLKNNRSKIMYFLAHSDINKGMYIGENSNLNGEKLATLFSNQPNRIPKLVILNTCYGVQSGLTEACLKVGVETAVASNKAVPIKYMCGYMEVLLAGWRNGNDIKRAIEQANRVWEGRGLAFKIKTLAEHSEIRKERSQKRTILITK